jgi:uracil-DNA glycosylase
VLILGQDPYHDDNQAHGLCFSVRPGIKPPPSLKNIFHELHDDVGFRIPNNGYLVPWAKQGILLLNAVLTVRAHQANSHKGKGWEVFTDAIIEKVAAKKDPVIFVLWGSYAQKKNQLVDTARHIIISSAHPSPLSARRGFFGSRPFSQINKALQDNGNKPIDWQLPDICGVVVRQAGAPVAGFTHSTLSLLPFRVRTKLKMYFLPVICCRFQQFAGKQIRGTDELIEQQCMTIAAVCSAISRIMQCPVADQSVIAH